MATGTMWRIQAMHSLPFPFYDTRRRKEKEEHDD
jgi:hypothetical protein